MASSPALQDRNVQRSKPPLTASPGFPWVVSLWFAALLGIGSLILPVALLERMSEASGLATILPQAAPPLGFTAQAMLAMAGTLGGALVGYVLAKRVAAPSQAKPARANRVFSAREDIGDEEFAGEDMPAAALQGPGTRRRALAMMEEAGPSDFLNLVPLPGAADDAVALKFTPEPDAEAAEQAPEQVEADADDQPFELDASVELAEDQEPAEDARQEFAPPVADEAPAPEAARQEFVAVAEAGEIDVVEADEASEARAEAAPLHFSPPSMERPQVRFTGFDAEDEDDNEAEDDETACEPGDRFAAPQAEAESEEDVSDKQIFDGADGSDETSEAPAIPQAFEPVSEDALVEASADVEVDESGEGLVQLVQRLGATLEKHREWSAEQAAAEQVALAAEPVVAQFEVEPEAESAPEPAEKPLLDECEVAGADDAAEAMAAWFGRPKSAEDAPVAEAVEPEVSATADEVEVEVQQSVPQRYGSFAGTLAEEEGDDDNDLDEIAASFSLPIATQQDTVPSERPHFDQSLVADKVSPDSAINEVIEDEDEDGDAASADSFGSLNPFKREREEFVRIEEPEPEEGSAEPAVLFPGQQPRQSAAAARSFDPPSGDAAAGATRPRPSNDDNERALREALMNLQRMGK